MSRRNIPNEIRERYPEIPWKEMVSFRDKLIHFYFGIKYEIVWDTIKLKLPELKMKIQRALFKIPPVEVEEDEKSG